MSSVPATRWVLEALVDVSALSAVQAACVQHGGFVAHAERFDCVRFGVSRAEASAMDPQQRLLLEVGYEALHGAGARRSSLLGGVEGVFVGIERPDWALAQPPTARRSVYAVTGDNVSVAAGRLSFVLGLQGPCASFETACSASLVACHSAARALQHRECETALVAGVNMLFSAEASFVTGLAGMTSPRGRSHTFDVRADGYARGEACCAAVLEGASIPRFPNVGLMPHPS